MKTYIITVKEILERQIPIEAESRLSARLRILEQYENEEIVLDSSDYKETNIR